MNTTTTTNESNSGTIDSAATATPRRNRRMRRAIGLALLSGTIGAASLNSAAHAGGPGESSPMKTVSTNVYSANPELNTMPTWLFGGTTFCVTSYSLADYNLTTPATTSVSVQIGSWAPEYLTVSPGETKCINRWWGAQTLKVKSYGRPGVIATY